jgi:hypothetical protein
MPRFRPANVENGHLTPPFLTVPNDRLTDLSVILPALPVDGLWVSYDFEVVTRIEVGKYED